MSQNIVGVVEQLRSEEARLGARVSELRSETRSAEQELTRVRDAIQALEGKHASSRRANKPSATQEEVLEAIREVLASGPLAEVELKARVGERLRESGKSLTGFALRFRQALSSQALLTSGDQIGLV